VTLFAYLRNFQFNLADAEPIQDCHFAEINTADSNIFCEFAGMDFSFYLFAKKINIFLPKQAYLAMPRPSMSIANYPITIK
jgi:hypothetical protein